MIAFAVASTLSIIAIRNRQERYEVRFTFTARTMAQGIELPASTGLSPGRIMDSFRRFLAWPALPPTITHNQGTFVVHLDSIRARQRSETEARLEEAYRKSADHFSENLDAARLSSRLRSMDARLELIEEALRTDGLSDYERYRLQARAMRLRESRDDARRQLDIVSTGIFTAPTTVMTPLPGMSVGVLLVLGLVLSGFVACATMVIADALGGSGARL